MEKTTIDTVLERINCIEQTVIDINQQLKIIVEELALKNKTQHRNIEKERTSSTEISKGNTELAERVFAEVFRKMGLPPDFEPISVEELRESMRQHGINAEDNEFSSAIIAEREK